MNVEKLDGTLGVKIVKNKYGIEFSTTRNGYQWSGFDSNKKLLRMMRDSINEYLSNNLASETINENP